MRITSTFGKTMSQTNAGPVTKHIPIPGRRAFGVGTSTYFVIGFVSAVALIAGIGMYGENHAAWSVVCLLSAPLIFTHFCFQKLEFSDGTMTLRRPFLPDKSIVLSTVSSVSVALVLVRGRPLWKCIMMGGETLLFEFNPKPYPFEAIDYMFDEVKAYSPSANTYNGTLEYRPKSKV